MKKAKVAFIGVGGYGRVILKDIFTSPMEDFEIVGYVDPCAKSSECYDKLQELGVVEYPSMEEMFATLKACGQQPDLTVIATPIQFHKEQILYAVAHGSNVLCEKPMTGDAEDLGELESLENNGDRFIAIGFQWSFSDAIQALKKDVMQGRYGAALEMKSLVLWPRDKNYFRRSWAAKVYASNGVKILDSIVNNATAHFLHNILYVLGDKVNGAATVAELEATLLRTNEIETFDTATIRFKTDKGVKGTYVVSHSTKEEIEPIFEYRFENGTVTYPDDNGNIVGKFTNGEIVDYGNPFMRPAQKFYKCIEMIQNGDKEPLCGVKAAKEHVKSVAKLHNETEIYNVRKEKIKQAEELLYVDGLYEMLMTCYSDNKLLSELDNFNELVKGDEND